MSPLTPSARAGAGGAGSREREVVEGSDGDVAGICRGNGGGFEAGGDRGGGIGVGILASMATMEKKGTATTVSPTMADAAVTFARPVETSAKTWSAVSCDDAIMATVITTEAGATLTEILVMSMRASSAKRRLSTLFLVPS